jgi:hypothetical protein
MNVLLYIEVGDMSSGEYGSTSTKNQIWEEIYLEVFFPIRKKKLKCLVRKGKDKLSYRKTSQPYDPSTPQNVHSGKN